MTNKESKITYDMEELLPIVADLAKKYTSGESSSVTYETAEMLMEAVLYCIAEYENPPQGLLARDIDAKTAYQAGYEIVCEKVRKANEIYIKIQEDFDSYGSIVYYDTVIKGMPAFFSNYDVRFRPMDTILTLDYPILCNLNESSGVDLILEYLNCIQLEQEFLREVDREYIIRIMTKYEPDYEEGFSNIAKVVYRTIIGYLLKRNYGDEVKAHLLESTRDELEDEISKLLQVMINDRFKQQKLMYAYFMEDCEDFAYELKNAAEHDCLKSILI